jgi:hypothetical protein
MINMIETTEVDLLIIHILSLEAFAWNLETSFKIFAEPDKLKLITIQRVENKVKFANYKIKAGIPRSKQWLKP